MRHENTKTPKTSLMRTTLALVCICVLAGSTWITGRAQTGGPIVSGAHRFEKVSDGIYYATTSGTMNVGANSPILVNDDEAIVIDSEITPAAARALVADSKALTNKPRRAVICT